MFGWGGVNMSKAHIYIIKQKNYTELGGCRLATGGGAFILQGVV